MNSNQTELLELASSILTGEISLSVGCLKIEKLLCAFNLATESDFLIITAFNSEVDHLPHEDQRPLWDEKIIKAKDSERAEIEKHYRQDILKACEKILARFAHH